ncbi:MAG: hypothetical protein IPJ89_05650 [Candidatus Iainarchaeum archaeon]|uniref:Uncharacterized protein n=1 Tax=Candidatus Iainarchaeum sp. TaxID=3101447 RepID=A0A7T9I210_9ARCH|nr:MAG: hypothetical protein IPJ89_05650 [Candidatus Diapherotrites archaeon]
MRTPWIIGIGFLLLLLSGQAVAQTVIPRVTENRVSFHSIDIFLQEDGSARVVEQFFFSFFADEAAQLEKDFEENTPSLFEWKRDYPFIHPYAGIESQAESLDFFLRQTVSGQPTLELSYNYPVGLAQKVATENQGRTARWKLSDSALLNFISAGSISIDAKTQVKIYLPTGAVVDKRLLQQGLLDNSNVITLSNFQSNALNVQYAILTPIADPIDTSKFISDVVGSPLFFFLVVALVLAGIYAYLNRESLSEKIEDYIVEHSEFKTAKGPEVDNDLE